MVCFFLSLLKRKLPRRCPKRGGGGEGHFWTMSERKQLFSPDDFPKVNIGNIRLIHMVDLDNMYSLNYLGGSRR